MTLKDAILKALENIERPANADEISLYIQDQGYYAFGKDKRLYGIMGDFIRKNDTRVGRTKEGKTYYYFLTKNEFAPIEVTQTNQETKKQKIDFYERDLHPLFVSYLKSKDIFAKTILHEESKNSKDDTQKWAHPDIVGVKFAKFTNGAASKLLKTLEKKDSCEIISYELKREINSDYDLKKSYFQAVSNSSWANKGYLVTFEINTNLYQEIERLNKAFGIGVIKLSPNPFESQVLYQSTYRELDYQTIDKLCNINLKYKDFIEQIEKILNAEDRYINSSLEELATKSDDYFTKDEEVKIYCENKNIPYGEDEI